MKAIEVTPGTFLDLEGITIPRCQVGGFGRRHVPNWVRSVRQGRVYTYFTLGDYRVWKVRKDDEVKTRKPYCFCESKTRAKITFFCPEHEALQLTK